jgi:hypothetical protein
VIAVDPNDTKAAMLSVLLLDFGQCGFMRGHRRG